MAPQPHLDPDVFFLPLAVKSPFAIDGLSAWVCARRIPDFLHQVINQGEAGPTGMLEVQTPPDGEHPVEWVRMEDVVPAEEAFAMLPPSAHVRAVVAGSLERQHLIKVFISWFRCFSDSNTLFPKVPSVSSTS